MEPWCRALIIAHLADMHLGAKPYQYEYRKKDILESFSETVDRLIELRPDLIVVAGDFFDSPHPGNDTLIHAVKEVKRLVDAGLKLVFTYGEHDYPKTRDRTPVEVLAEAIGYGVYSPPRLEFRKDSPIVDPFILPMNNITVYLVPFVKASEKTREAIVKRVLDAFENDRRSRGGKSILVAHLGIRTLFPYGSVLDNPGLLPRVDYAALGHIHRPYICIKKCLDDGVTPFAYTGSLEPLRKNEVHEGMDRGFLLVDIGGDEPVVEKIRLKTIRPQYIIDTTPERLISDLRRLLHGNPAGSKKPLVHVSLTVTREGRLTSRGLVDLINRASRELDVYLRVEYIAPRGGEPGKDTRLSSSLDLREIVASIIDPHRRFDQDKRLKAADSLLHLKKALLEGDDEEVDAAIKLLEAYSPIIMGEEAGWGLERFMG